MPSTGPIDFSVVSSSLPRHEARLALRWGLRTDGATCVYSLHKGGSLPSRAWVQLPPRSEAKTVLHSHPLLQVPAHGADHGQRELRGASLPSLSHCFGGNFSGSWSPNTPPIIPHQGCLGIGSNWVQISVLLLTTRLLNFWKLSFFTSKPRGLPNGAPTSWVLGEQYVHSPRRTSGLQQVLTDVRLPGLAPLSWCRQPDQAPVFSGGDSLTPSFPAPEPGPILHPHHLTLHPAPGSLPGPCPSHVRALGFPGYAGTPPFPCFRARLSLHLCWPWLMVSPRLPTSQRGLSHQRTLMLKVLSSTPYLWSQRGGGEASLRSPPGSWSCCSPALVGARGTRPAQG